MIFAEIILIAFIFAIIHCIKKKVAQKVVISSFMSCLFGCGATAEDSSATPRTDNNQKMSYPIKATCSIAPKGKPCGGGEEEAPGCTGVVHFEQVSADKTIITWDLQGCGAAGLHGFHIHEKADFSNGCMSAGPHYNPFGTNRNIIIF